MPAVLVHHGLLVGHGVGPGAAAPAAVAGGHHRRAVVVAEGGEGDEDGKQGDEDGLGHQNDAHLTGHAGQGGDVHRHQHQGQIELQEHVLDGIHLGDIGLHMGGLQNVADDAAGEQAADELGHLDLGDVVQQAVDGHTQGADEQHQAEAGDHAAVDQGIDRTGLGGVGLVVGIGLQVVTGDEEGGHRSADERAHDVAHGAGGHAHLSGVFRGTQLDEDGAEGGGGAHTAGHGGGGALQAQQGVHPDELGHHNAQHVLHGDEQTGGQGDLHAQFAAGVFQQLGAEAIAHAHEENVLAQVLNGAHVKG